MSGKVYRHKMAEYNVIERLESLVEKMLEQNVRAEEQIAKLQRKNSEQALKIRALQQQIKSDREEFERLQLSAAMQQTPASRRVAKAQINRLLREVEKCIDLVSARI